MNKKLGFSDRLQNARDLHSILMGFEGYNPPRPTESLDGFQNFIESLVLANKNVADHNGIFRLAAGNRSQKFFESDNSVIKLFSNIMLYVKARYGAKSTEFAILSTIMKKMRSSKLLSDQSSASPAGAADDMNNEKEQKTTRSYSRSARSFGTMTQNFHDFITTVLNFEGYSPEFVEYKPENLTAILNIINDANTDVTTKKSNLSVAQDDRKAIFDELRERSIWIKSYVKYKYGADSTEYNQVRSFRF